MNLFPFAMTPFRPSAKYMLFRTSPWILLYVAAITCVFLINTLFLVFALLLLLAFFYHFLLLSAELYIISPDMLMVSTGIANKAVKWFAPLKIKKIKLHQTRLMKCIHIFNIKITSDEEINIALTLKGTDVNTFIEALRLNVDVLEARHAYDQMVVRVLELADTLAKEHGK